VLVAVSAATVVPGAVHEIDSEEDDEDRKSDWTLEQRLLDHSEKEHDAQHNRVNKERSIFYRFFKHLKIAFTKYIYEPIATGLRFIQLVIIFVPVLATIPIMFVGARDPERENERAGTLWWYSFLVKQMERAGPTFIKV
jgi:aarF domain-containing kinase